MQAKDLRVEPPRRWNERVDGVPWLPRLIDKARAAHAGTLGLGHRYFAKIVAGAKNDSVNAITWSIKRVWPSRALERLR